MADQIEHPWPYLRTLFEVKSVDGNKIKFKRLFSAGGLILSPRRACIGDINFENQLLLKLNKSYV